jgi:hypothetical protein
MYKSSICYGKYSLPATPVYKFLPTDPFSSLRHIRKDKGHILTYCYLSYMEETEEIPYLVNNLSNKIELIRK